MALLLYFYITRQLTNTLICILVDGPFQFDFVILVAGFKSRQKPHENLYTKKFTVPSLHVFGDSDKVIPKGQFHILTKN